VTTNTTIDNEDGSVVFKPTLNNANGNLTLASNVTNKDKTNLTVTPTITNTNGSSNVTFDLVNQNGTADILFNITNGNKTTLVPAKVPTNNGKLNINGTIDNDKVNIIIDNGKDIQTLKSDPKLPGVISTIKPKNKNNYGLNPVSSADSYT
jgi:hypothetical protein